MEELTEEIFDKIDTLCEEINEFIDSKKYSEALGLCEKGYSLLPEPKENWYASFWFYVTFGDIYFLIKRADVKIISSGNGGVVKTFLYKIRNQHKTFLLIILFLILYYPRER